MHQSNVLVFSVALNGYQWLYRPLFETHRKYSERYGYSYQLVDSPSCSNLGIEVAWLKLHLIKSALQAGYDWVVFLDADTEVSESTPCVESLYCPRKSIYVTNGYSGEINSGVLIVKNHFSALAFVDNVIKKMGVDIPEKSIVDWGENGYVIHVSKTSNCVHIIDQRWNNNSKTELNDFIRHYSDGPLKKLFEPKKKDLLLYQAFHYWVAVSKRLSNLLKIFGKTNDGSSMDRLHQTVLQRYSVFGCV